MSFGAPQWLWGLLTLPALAAGLWLLARSRRQRLERWAAPGSLGRIDLTRPSSRPLWRNLLVLLAAALTLVALARPRWGESEEEIHARGLDLIIALDLSRSMLAEDVAPSRLMIARSMARELGRRLPSDRVGLLGFAGQAGLLCPMTLDRGSLELYLAAADPTIFPDQGTDLGRAIELAVDAFRQRARARRVLVVISDGEDLEAGAMAAVATAVESGVRIYTIGVGTPQGAPIPERDADGRVTGYIRDRSGQVVTSRLDERVLAAVAEAGGGAYVRATGFDAGVEQVVEALSKMERSEWADTLFVRHAEQYRWPLGAVFLLVLLEAGWLDRRKT
ncbi:MAG: VWA domain-containing protein [Acidobacteriota bacterium]|nr:VWA domain-containing protein [Acidobacteriota bacterium]